MRNPFDHAFTPGFNWWYVMAVLGIIAIALVGWNKYYVHIECVYRRRLAKHYNDKFISFVSTLITIIIMVMVYKESVSGIIQFLDNGLAADESPVYSVLGAPFVMLGLGGLYWVLLNSIGLYMAKKRKALLKRRLNGSRD